MVDLKAKPYYLSDEDIKWVEDTIAGMTDEEKVGQLFVNMVTDFTPEGIKKVADTYHPGALRYHNKSAEELWDMVNTFQNCSKIPLLVASNCEAGGNGGVGGGTGVSCGAATAASRNPDVAYKAAKVGGTEAMASRPMARACRASFLTVDRSVAAMWSMSFMPWGAQSFAISASSMRRAGSMMTPSPVPPKR